MKILIIDDDHSSLESLKKFLISPLNHEVTTFDNCEEALERFKLEPFPLVISDIKMPGLNGLELLREIKSFPEGYKTDVVLMTGFGDIDTCIEALRLGASDYLLKPVSVKQLDVIITRLNKTRELQNKYTDLKEHFHEKLDESINSYQTRLSKLELTYSELLEDKEIGFFSDSMQQIVELGYKFHDQPHIPVLIEGETGTGKEIIAHLIHSGGKPASAPFISLNCSAISPTLFESELFGYEEGAFTGAKKKGALGKLELAQDGTIFLDEIGDMPLEMQPKLLRVFQQKEIYRLGGQQKIKLNVRFICATNQSLQEKVKSGSFRNDLYYRLNTGYINIPPLRERKTEIAPLARLFLRNAAKKNRKDFEFITRDAVYILEDYDWPGNVRELKSVIERVVLLYNDKILKPEHINFMVYSSPEDSDLSNRLVFDFPDKEYPIQDIEYKIAKKVYKMFDGNITKAAKYLNIAWATFVKMAKLKN